MIVEAVFRDPNGWGVDVMTRVLGIGGVMRVDGTNLRPDGRFAHMHAWFPSEEAAKPFLEDLVRLGARPQRVM